MAPLVRECGEQVESPVVTLHEHLGHAGCVAEVSVDLKRRMGVEKVGIDAAAQHIVDDGVGVIAVLQTCPEIDFPAYRPAGGLVAALYHGVAHGLEKFRGGVGRYLCRGIKTEGVRYVAVAVLGFVIVAEPLLELVMASYVHGRELGYGGRERVDVGLSFAKHTGCT